jgi:hypothetical protein
MSAFHDYVRGLSDTVPDGYAENGMRLYRHLVYLGASQLLEAHYPELHNTLGEDDWRTLIEAFIRSSRWESHYYGDLADEFLAFLEEQAG